MLRSRRILRCLSLCLAVWVWGGSVCAQLIVPGGGVTSGDIPVDVLDEGDNLIAPEFLRPAHPHTVTQGAPGAGTCLFVGEKITDALTGYSYNCTEVGGNPLLDDPGDAFNTVSNGTTTCSATASATLQFPSTATLTCGTPTIVTLDTTRIAVCTTTADDDNSNTNALQTLLTCSIPANTLGTSRCLKATMFGQVLFNGGGTLTFTLNYGAGTAAEPIGTIASTRNFVWEAYVCGDGATNDQEASWHVAATTVHIGEYAQFAVDSTAAQTFSLQAQFSTASTSNIINARYSYVRIE